ncbi:MAG: hypothetical protein FJZ92_06120 [Chloroflexi bacterium]|nr:hypothetical protein [Chloroflexota bacterium]
MPENEAPPRIQPKRLGDYLEVISKAVFQTGISWRVVDSKWPDIREAMRDFGARAVAGLGARDIDRLAADPRVIRSHKKLEAIAGNAARMLEMEAEHGSFRAYLRSHADFEALVKDLRKQFKFLGAMGCYYFLHVVGERVPDYEEWHAAHTDSPAPTRRGWAAPDRARGDRVRPQCTPGAHHGAPRSRRTPGAPDSRRHALRRTQRERSRQPLPPAREEHAAQRERSRAHAPAGRAALPARPSRCPRVSERKSGIPSSIIAPPK